MHCCCYLTSGGARRRAEPFVLIFSCSSSFPESCHGSSSQWFYADRITRRNRDHLHSRLPVDAGGAEGACRRRPDTVPEQSHADRPGAAWLSRCQEASATG